MNGIGWMDGWTDGWKVDGKTPGSASVVLVSSADDDWIDEWTYKITIPALQSITSVCPVSHLFHRELQDLLYSFVTSNSSDSILSTILADSNVTSKDVTRLRQQLTPLFPANYR